MPGKFELYKDVRERYRFRLISENGELILSGDGYTQKVLALDAIVSIMRSASEAAVIDLSLPDEGEIDIEEEHPVWDGGSDGAYRDDPDSPARKKSKRKGGKKGGKGKKSKKRKQSKRSKKNR